MPGSAALQAIVLQPGDMPSGWTGAAYQPDPSEATEDAQFDQCAGIPDTRADLVAEAHSDDYSQGASTISSSAMSFRSATAVSEDVSAITGGKAAACFQSLFNAQMKSALPSGTTVSHLQVSVSAGSAGGPSDVIGTASVTGTVSAQGQSAAIDIGAYFIAKGQVEAEISFDGVGTPVESGLQSQLLRVVADRVASG